MQLENECIPIPVSCASAIAKDYQKDIVIILAFDHKKGMIQTTTFGATGHDKIVASELGLAITKSIGGDVERKTVFEDPEGLMGEKV